MLGVSPALIGHIETGRNTPSVNTLFGLATALDIPIASLFEEENLTPIPDPDALVHVTSAGDRAVYVSAPGLSRQPFTRPHSQLYFGLMAIDAGASTAAGGDPVGHEGTEYGYVLSGELHLEVGGELRVLHTGDSFEFDAKHPHSLTNPGPHPTHLLWVQPLTPRPPASAR